MRPSLAVEFDEVRARVLRNSGTRMVVALDGSSVTRLAQCQCGASVALRGDPARLWAEGWGSYWRCDTRPPRREWRCPECWSPPALAETPPIYRLPTRLRRMALARVDSSPRKAAEEVLRRLELVEPERARAYLEQLAGAGSAKAEYYVAWLGAEP